MSGVHAALAMPRPRAKSQYLRWLIFFWGFYQIVKEQTFSHQRRVASPPAGIRHSSGTPKPVKQARTRFSERSFFATQADEFSSCPSRKTAICRGINLAARSIYASISRWFAHREKNNSALLRLALDQPHSHVDRLTVANHRDRDFLARPMAFDRGQEFIRRWPAGHRPIRSNRPPSDRSIHRPTVHACGGTVAARNPARWRVRRASIPRCAIHWEFDKPR